MEISSVNGIIGRFGITGLKSKAQRLKTEKRSHNNNYATFVIIEVSLLQFKHHRAGEITVNRFS